MGFGHSYEVYRVDFCRMIFRSFHTAVKYLMANWRSKQEVLKVFDRDFLVNLGKKGKLPV